MLSEELRIGNLVNHYGGGDFIDQKKGPLFLAKITGLGPGSCQYELLEECPNYYHKYIEPIPLTEDWLLRAGFELHNDYVYPKGDNKYNFCLKKIDGKYYYGTSHYNGSFEIKSTAIEYVHRLQNIWFDTAGQELEFKL